MNNNVCLDLPKAFWHRKKHIVQLPYVKDFNERTFLLRLVLFK